MTAPAPPPAPLPLPDDLRIMYRGLRAREDALAPLIAEFRRDLAIVDAIAASRAGTTPEEFRARFEVDALAGVLVPRRPAGGGDPRADDRPADD